MANLKLLQEAIEAFANGEQAVADKKMRKYFVEQAQEINKELEESMEEEECEVEEKDEEKLDEDFDVQPDAGLNAEIGFALGEEDESAEEEVEFGAEDDGADVEVDAEAEVSGETPSEDQWESIQDAFRGLQQMFDEIGGGEVDLDAEDEVEVGAEEFGADGEESEEEFGDVQFGDEKVGESFKLKQVGAVDKKEKAGVNTKSPVAPEAKSPVQGVAPVKFAKASEQQVDDDFETKDTLSHTDEDMGKNARGEMKDVAKPKNTAAKARSPLPKSQPKL